MRKRAPIAIGCVTLIYWALFYVWVFQDLYLSWPQSAFVLKALFPLALIANIAGLVFALRLRATPGSGSMAAVAINGAPLVAVLVFFWWLFFGVSI